MFFLGPPRRRGCGAWTRRMSSWPGMFAVVFPIFVSWSSVPVLAARQPPELIRKGGQLEVYSRSTPLVVSWSSAPSAVRQASPLLRENQPEAVPGSLVVFEEEQPFHRNEWLADAADAVDDYGPLTDLTLLEGPPGEVGDAGMQGPMGDDGPQGERGPTPPTPSSSKLVNALVFWTATLLQLAAMISVYVLFPGFSSESAASSLRVGRVSSWSSLLSQRR